MGVYINQRKVMQTKLLSTIQICYRASARLKLLQFHMTNQIINSAKAKNTYLLSVLCACEESCQLLIVKQIKLYLNSSFVHN